MRTLFRSLVYIWAASQLGSGFVPSSHTGAARIHSTVASDGAPTTPFSRMGSCHHYLPLTVQRQRRSVPAAYTQMMGVFGLGVGEIVIILVGIGVLLGPEKLMELAQSSGDTANEFKDELAKVPGEFQKGVEEGEIEARSRKAKPVKMVRKRDDGGDGDDET